MERLAFEWDRDKEALNLAKHGIDFSTSSRVFGDPFALEWIDNRRDYGEPRYIVVGMIDQRLVFVAYTTRGDAIRIISARAAEPLERRRYHEHDE